MVLIADADAAQAVRVAEQATEIAALKARLALYEGDAPDGGDAPPPALFLDPTGLARVRAAAAATRGEDKKVELPDLVPGFKSSALDIGEHFSSPAGHSREAGGLSPTPGGASAGGQTHSDKCAVALRAIGR
jgi:hypothetical protein